MDWIFNRMNIKWIGS